jgi:hypothetical protein
METSMVAQIIYDNNPLLDVMDGFIPTELRPERWVAKAGAIAETIVGDGGSGSGSGGGSGGSGASE